MGLVIGVGYVGLDAYSIRFIKFAASSIIENNKSDFSYRLMAPIIAVGRFDQIRVICICLHIYKRQ
jgi:hypothetical protein